MVTRDVLASVAIACCLGSIHEAHAQNVQRVQPIVLTASPACCQSPAATASQLVALPCGDRTYLPPEDRDPIRVIPTSSQLMPLPTAQEWRGYESRATSVTGYPETVTSYAPSPSPYAPSPSVQVFRPVVTTPPVPSVPDGYVVGTGLIGQPKLYKPGQPVRNFLRYITL